jgi:hypothetical protein
VGWHKSPYIRKILSIHHLFAFSINDLDKNEVMRLEEKKGDVPIYATPPQSPNHRKQR